MCIFVTVLSMCLWFYRTYGECVVYMCDCVKYLPLFFTGLMESVWCICVTVLSMCLCFYRTDGECVVYMCDCVKYVPLFLQDWWRVCGVYAFVFTGLMESVWCICLCFYRTDGECVSRVRRVSPHKHNCCTSLPDR